ncbi:hypothetical protein D3C74_331170 [compost metagenome]
MIPGRASRYRVLSFLRDLRKLVALAVLIPGLSRPCVSGVASCIINSPLLYTSVVIAVPCFRKTLYMENHKSAKDVNAIIINEKKLKKRKRAG